MEYKNLGRTGIKVSRLCLGTMNFGIYTDESDSHAIMDEALDKGINFFDTADVYGGIINKRGISEEIVGKWLSKSKNRDKVIIATKVRWKMGQGQNDWGLSAYHIKRACEASLKRLKIDHIDLYQMHFPDGSATWEEKWEAFSQLRQEGKILYVGTSNHPAWELVLAQKKAEEKNFLGIVSEQSRYNLEERSIELEVIPACRELGLGLVTWSPLAGGILAGKIGQAVEGRRQKEEKAYKKLKLKINKYLAFCSSIGYEPQHVALAWLMSNKVVTCPIIGPRNLSHLKDSFESLKIKLSEEELKELDNIWPKIGEAPFAYTTEKM